MEHWLAYLLVGLVCGLFSASFGVGSGIILIPVMVILFGFPQKSAQGIALTVMVSMALVGAIRYKLNPAIEVNMIVVGLLTIGGVIGAFFGSSIASAASGSILRKLFAVIMIVAALRMLIVPAKKVNAPAAEKTPAAQDGSPEKSVKDKGK